MSRTAPWHVAREAIYHNTNACDLGAPKRIGASDGTGGKRLCASCDALNRADSAASLSALSDPARVNPKRV